MIKEARENLRELDLESAMVLAAILSGVLYEDGREKAQDRLAWISCEMERVADIVNDARKATEA